MLNEREVADIMKKDVPRLLHKRIAELEGSLGNLIHACENNTGYEPSLSCYQYAIDCSKEVLEKEII